MGINTPGTKEAQDKKYDDKKSSNNPVDKVVEETKNKVRDIQKKS